MAGEVDVRELALFAGAGGGILGGLLLGWRTVCAVELDAYARDVLVARQNDGCLAPFPIWDDIRTFDGRPWRGAVDVVSGGFPCQDISAAGKGAGIDGARSGLWSEMARVIGEVRPRYVFVENSPMLVRRGLARVLGDLATLGYDAHWGVVGADDVGAPHLRERVWILAYTNGKQLEDWGASQALAGIRCNVADSVSLRELQPQGCECEERGRTGNGGSMVPDAEVSGFTNAWGSSGAAKTLPRSANPSWWQSEPAVGRVAHGVAHRVDRLRGIGNGQVPAVARLAWEMLANGR